MLNFDKAGMSQAQLGDEVAAHCAQFGPVKNIKILPPAAHRDYSIAAVEMAELADAEKLRVKTGDLKIGSVVIIRLIVGPDAQPAAAASSSESTAAPAEREPVDILLVEDDPADVRMIREALKAAGVPHHLHVVCDGLEAISFLYRTRQFDAAPEPDIVLVDLNLPKVNGHEVLLEIKSSDNLRHIPVVVLTSSRAARDLRLSYQADADWFLTKPTGLAAYADAMKKVEVLIEH